MRVFSDKYLEVCIRILACLLNDIKFSYMLFLFYFVDTGAGGLINPNKTYADVEKEMGLGHELYVKSHADFNVGEKLHRSYTAPNFQSTSKFGIPTPHDNTGKNVIFLVSKI